MTQSENKHSNSEISNGQEPYFEGLNEYCFRFNYQLLNGHFSSHLILKRATYFNIMLRENAENISYRINNKFYLLNRGENIIHFIEDISTIEIFSNYETNELFLISISAEYFEAFHEKNVDDPSRFRNGFFTKSDSRIHLLLKNIASLDETNSLNKLKIESIVLELLIRQIEILYVENDNKQVILQKNHYDKILAVKKLIDSDLSKSYSLSELSKIVGTNEQYLKKYFKQYFGKTVQSYITEKKMEHAKELILKGDYRVADVARLTGYKHSTHFTTAFKKYFGLIPNSLRYTFLVAHEGVVALAESGISNLL